MEQASHMIGMIGDAKARLDQLGDARRGPEIGGIAGREGAGEERVHEPPLLRRRELGRPARRRMDYEAVGPLVRDRISPAHHGTRRAPHAPRDVVQRDVLVRLQQCERPSPARFQHRGSTLGSHPSPL